jgi:hypothetical protein
MKDNIADDYIVECLQTEVQGKKILSIKTAGLGVLLYAQAMTGGQREVYCYLKREPELFSLYVCDQWWGFEGKEVTFADLARAAETAYGLVPINLAMDVLNYNYDQVNALIEKGTLQTSCKHDGVRHIMPRRFGTIMII